MIRAAIFDMDGTILDTVADLTAAMNFALRETGHRCDFTGADTRFFFGSGAKVAVRRALFSEAGAGKDDLLLVGTDKEPPVSLALMEESERVTAIFAPRYAAHCNEQTGPYPGIPEAISALRQAGIRTAVVSNKLDAAVQILVRDLFPGLFDIAVGERPQVRRKPAPDMLTHALEALRVQPEKAVYIGDTEVDQETAKNSNLPFLCVTWGFRSEDYLRSLGAHRFAHSAEEMQRALTAWEAVKGEGK